MSALRPAPGEWADRLGLAVLAAITIAIVAPRVAGFTTDSDAYLDVAANLLAGRGLTQTVVDFWRPGLPDPLGMWPPLFPLAVAGLAGLGVPLAPAGRLVAMLGLVAFALAFHALARRAGGRGLAAVATGLVLLAPGMAQAGVTAWSETLYLLLLTGAIVATIDLARAPRPSIPPVAAAAGAGLLLGLAADTRYIGIGLVPLAAALLWGAGVRGRAHAAWSAAAALPIVLWLAHNLAAFGRPLGPALAPGTRSIAAVAGGLLGALRWDFLPYPLARPAWVALAALAGVAVAAAWAWRSRGAARWAVAIAAAQLALVGLAVWGAGINEPHGRYTLVAWPFLTLAVCAAADAGLTRAFGASSAARRARVAAAALALVCVAAGLARFLSATSVPPAAALARRQAQDAMVRLVPPGDSPILSDHGHLLRLATGHAAVQVPPSPFRAREFTAADARRWRERGVTRAIFRADAAVSLGPYLAERLSGSAGSWAFEDSAAGFARFRIGP